MYAAPGMTPEQTAALWKTQSDIPLDQIETLEDALVQVSRAREKAEKYRAEVADLKDAASGAYGLRAKITGLEKEIEKLKADKEEMKLTVTEYETKLLVASGATQGSRDRETVKALQSADLAQRKTISNQLLDIEGMLLEIKLLRKVLAGEGVDLEGIQTWEDMRPTSTWERNEPTVGELGLCGGSNGSGTDQPSGL